MLVLFIALKLVSGEMWTRARKQYGIAHKLTQKNFNIFEVRLTVN